MESSSLNTKMQALLIILVAVAIGSCLSNTPNRRSESSADASYLSAVPLGINPGLPEPWDNRLTAEKAELGKLLFFDTRLSRDGTVSCATCHLPERAFSDGQAIAVGIDDRLRAAQCSDAPQSRLRAVPILGRPGGFLGRAGSGTHDQPIGVGQYARRDRPAA